MISVGFLTCLVGFLLPLTTAGDSSTSEGRRVWCYYTNWAQYRPGKMRYTVEDTAPHLCTHFSFAFATMKNNLIMPYENNDDDRTFGIGMYTKFNRLRSKNPRLKTFLSVGGWNFGSAKFSEMASSPASRLTFINSAVTFLRQRNFNGLDLDWEYPTQRNGSADDKKHFSLLIKELKEAFLEESRLTNKAPLLLAVAVGAAKHVIDSAYDVPEISRFVDFINIMSYDFHGSWDNKTGHPSPLFAGRNEKGTERYWNMAWSAIYWVKKGAPLGKLNVGIPFYGRSFTLSDPKENGVGAKAPLPGQKGAVTRSEGVLSYFEACQMLRNGAERFFIADQKVPYLVQNDQWLGYEDIESVVAKVEWILQNHFSGVMIWTIDLDDYKGLCGHGRYPLMEAVNRAIYFYIQKPVTVPTPLETTTSDEKPETSCDFCKSRPFGVYRSRVSCRHFVLCMDGDSFLNQCPPTKTEWHSTMGRCVPRGYGDCLKTAM